MRTGKIVACLALGIALTIPSALAMAQNIPPFFGPGVVAFDPQVDVVRSGGEMVVGAAVSPDLKYVTLNMQPTLTHLRSLTPVAVSNVQLAGQGFAGGINLPSGNVAAGARASVAAGGVGDSIAAPSPDALSRAGKSWILTREGMYLVKRLN
jgi:hypothetical protein